MTINETVKSLMIEKWNMREDEQNGRVKIKCAVCGTEFKPKKEMRYTGKTYGMVEDIFHDCYDCPNCGAQYVAQKRIKEVRKISDDLISRKSFMEYLGLEDTEENREENVGEIVTLEDFDRQATAFGKEKVIEELKGESREIHQKG